MSALDNELVPMTRHCLFGVTMASNFPFASYLGAAGDRVELRLHCVDHPPESPGLETVEPAFVSSNRLEDGRPAQVLYRGKDQDLLRYSGVADYSVGPDTITCHVQDPAFLRVIEIQFLGTVMSLWLERSGVPTLHASAVAVEGHAVAFLGGNKSGKSALAATLVENGHHLLTDDKLAIDRAGDDFLARPSFPQMRMWPEQAAHFVGDIEGLSAVHPEINKLRVPIGPGGFGSFSTQSPRLACVYLPTRREGADPDPTVEISPLSGASIAYEFVRNAAVPQLVNAMGLGNRQLDFFADLLRRVAVRKIVYPSGLENLNIVRDAIVRDVMRNKG